MSVSLRLTRAGRKKLPFYHVVVADSRRARDGKFIEKLGYFDPLKKELKWDAERVTHWLNVGAQPSDRIAKMLIKEGVGPDKVRAKFQKQFDTRIALKADELKAKKEAEAAAAKEAEAKAKAEAKAAEEAAAAEAKAAAEAEAAQAAEAPTEEAPAEEAPAAEAEKAAE